MRVLILGSGGREHAVAWKLKQDDPTTEIISAPGNPGLESLGRCVAVNPVDVAAVVHLAREVLADLVFVGPEAPLEAGVVDALREAGVAAFGPTKAAAQLEASKRFAKELMLAVGIPTAAASWHTDAAEAKLAARLMGAPVVIKASGLAAGKGVVVAETIEDAEAAIDAMLVHGAFGRAGAEVLVEEFMAGEELSVFVITDGKHVVLLPPAQDHKRLKDGDRGPNTGGMGAYTPVTTATAAVLRMVTDQVVRPLLTEMEHRGAPFTGLLYCGMMLTATGPRVVEFNCRFGDPETQVVLPALSEPLLPLLVASSTETLSDKDLSAGVVSAVTTVVAAPGYPETPRVGAPLVLPDAPAGVVVFHAGTRRGDSGIVSAGGRVLAVTGVAADFAEACELSRTYAAGVKLADAQYRSDIGWRELERNAGAS